MKLFNNVGVIGLGLIGGSIAGIIKSKKIANKVIGVSRKKQTLFFAKKNRVIDFGSQDIRILKDVDLLIIATPVRTILETAPLLKKIIKPQCIVTDVGSTKKEIVNKLEKAFPNFIGSHPLAGSEKRGIQNYSQKLLKESICILTPSRNTNKKALLKIKELWIKLGAKVTCMSPDLHDKILSSVSHLPHAISFSLMNSVPQEYTKFAAGSLRDTTRIAVSDSKLWQDIFLSNRVNLIKDISGFEKKLARLKSAIIKKDKNLLNKLLTNAKEKREALENR